MLTVLESIKLSTKFLEDKGIESPRINAELLLAKILNCRRLDLYLMFDRPLKEPEVTAYREFLKRRGKFEPLQYIVGAVEFYGLEFKVDKSVLIPRPETELLVEKIINDHPGEEPLKILDIGTGSGNISVCLAKFIKNAHIISIDISEDALKLGKENAEWNTVLDKIKFINADITAAEIFSEENFSEEKFDVVVSNPPYVSSDDYSALAPELKFYEPKIALTDGKDGLSFYNVIAKKAGHLLKNGGRLYFELGAGLCGEVARILEQNNFINIEVKKDYQNIERVIKGELN